MASSPAAPKSTPNSQNEAASIGTPPEGTKFEKLETSGRRKPYNRSENLPKHGQQSIVPMPDFRVALGKGDSTLEGDKMFRNVVTEKTRTNPLVPLGMLATVGALVYGLRAFARGDRHTSQLMMRYRVGFQFATILAISAGLAMSSYKSGAEDASKDH